MSISTTSKIAAIFFATLAFGIGNASAQQASATLNNGTLEIVGTHQDDFVEVKAQPLGTLLGQGKRLTVSIDRRAHLTFAIEDVDRIVFSGGAGDDTFRILPNSSGLSINYLRRSEGLSNITTVIRGGSGMDVLEGGDDVIDEIHYSKEDLIVTGGNTGIMGRVDGDVFVRPSAVYSAGGYLLLPYPMPDDFERGVDTLRTDYFAFIKDNYGYFNF